MALCPANDCEKQTREPELLCKKHWFQLPDEMRRRIWALFKSAPGSWAHRKVCFDAIEYVNALQAPRQARFDL